MYAFEIDQLRPARELELEAAVAIARCDSAWTRGGPAPAEVRGEWSKGEQNRRE